MGSLVFSIFFSFGCATLEISMILAPFVKQILNKMKSPSMLMVKMYGRSDEHKKKYHLAKWDILCRPKDQGDLGIEDLKIKNKCLLSK